MGGKDDVSCIHCPVGRCGFTGRVVEVQVGYLLIEIIPDLKLKLDVVGGKLFMPGMISSIHRSCLPAEEQAA